MKKAINRIIDAALMGRTMDHVSYGGGVQHAIYINDHHVDEEHDLFKWKPEIEEVIDYDKPVTPQQAISLVKKNWKRRI